MYNAPYPYPYSYLQTYSYPYSYSQQINVVPTYFYGRTPAYGVTPQELNLATGFAAQNSSHREGSIELKDYGKNPFVVDIEKAAKQNNTFRTALWTGDHLQLTVMSIPVGENIGLEVHPTVDQFLRIEEGQGIIQIGDTKDHLYFAQRIDDDSAILIPAGKWHNLTNTGQTPLKLYTIYAPPQHPFGTVHQTKADAMAAD